MSTESDEGLGTTRMVALSDGVFSVAMTLLLADFITQDGLRRFLSDPERHIRLFAVTFFVVAIYWMAHQNEIRYLRATTRVTLWFNMVFLASVALMPLSLAVFGHEFASCPPRAGRYYLLNAAAMGVLLSLLFICIARGRTNEGKPLITDQGRSALSRTVLRNMFLPVAYLVLFWDLERGSSECTITSDSWVIQHLDWGTSIPPATYWLLTLGLSLTPKSISPRIRRGTLVIVVILAMIISAGTLFALDFGSFIFVATIGGLTILDVYLFFRARGEKRA